MLLNELFDAPLDYKRTSDSEYRFNTDSGDSAVVKFIPKKHAMVGILENYLFFNVFTNEETRKYYENLDKIRPIMSSAFKEMPVPIALAFQVNEKFGITGKGEQYKVFSTVVAIVKEHFNEANPDILYMIAEESSRIKLYSRMVKMFPNKTIKVDYKDAGATAFVNINKKTESVISNMVNDVKRVVSSL